MRQTHQVFKIFFKLKRGKKSEGSKVKKEKSLLREIGKAYASIPKEASKATKRMAKNVYEDVVKEAPDMIKEIPGAIANIKQVSCIICTIFYINIWIHIQYIIAFFPSRDIRIIINQGHTIVFIFNV